MEALRSVASTATGGRAKGSPAGSPNAGAVVVAGAGRATTLSAPVERTTGGRTFGTASRALQHQPMRCAAVHVSESLAVWTDAAIQSTPCRAYRTCSNELHGARSGSFQSCNFDGSCCAQLQTALVWGSCESLDTFKDELSCTITWHPVAPAKLFKASRGAANGAGAASAAGAAAMPVVDSKCILSGEDTARPGGSAGKVSHPAAGGAAADVLSAAPGTFTSWNLEPFDKL